MGKTLSYLKLMATAALLGAALLLFAGPAFSSTNEAPAAAVQSVKVAGTDFIITLADGRVLTGPGLVGVVLRIGDAKGGTLATRIDAIQPDPKDPSGEIKLYVFSVEDGAGGWRNLCNPDPAGERFAFPLAGTWTASGEHLPSETRFSLTCTSGAEGKCVRAGYKPWANAADGTPLWDIHQACVRLFRADYCGDGRSFTRDGTLIDFYDRLGIQADEPAPGMTFEAGWGPQGAVCVAHPRIPENASLDELARTCPRLRTALLGEGCSEATAEGAVVFNRSF